MSNKLSDDLKDLHSQLGVLRRAAVAIAASSDPAVLSPPCFILDQL